MAASYKVTELAAVNKKIASVDMRIAAENAQITKFATSQATALTKFNTKSNADLAKLNTEKTQLIQMRDFLNTLPN